MLGALENLSEALNLTWRAPDRWTSPREAGRLRNMSERTSSRHLALVRPSVKPGDHAIERAITLMQGDVARAWTVTELARRVGLSRPAFARRFVAHAGISPLRYLTRYRMERAAEMLAQPELRLAQVAGQVGYSSEYAFNRAFKRQHRVAPGTFRRQLGARAVPDFRLAA
jgi:transcriptional regulator GlxA family with amidase domain